MIGWTLWLVILPLILELFECFKVESIELTNSKAPGDDNSKNPDKEQKEPNSKKQESVIFILIIILKYLNILIFFLNRLKI